MGMQPCEDRSVTMTQKMDDPFWDHLAPCRHRLYAFIKKSLNYSEDADDLYQETILRACRYFPTYRQEHPFRTWLYAIAHNELKKVYKSRSLAPDRLPDELTVVSDETGLTAQDHEEIRRMHALAMDFKPAWREVFFLFYQEGFSVEEVAGVTNRSAGHVKFILFRCRKAVRARLGVIS
jgi:RNA polymerase sigma-70 factor (ECF subfamily)